MRKYWAALLILLFMVPSGQAQLFRNVTKVGITAASFLEIGVGARAIGMGGAFVGTASDASALYWNVAGIARLNQPEVLLVHTKWLADMKFDFAGFVLPLGSFGTLGGSITALSMDDMMVRTVERPQGTGEFFSAGDLAIAISYARNLTDRFAIGFTGKYVQQNIWKETAHGFALDVGTYFVTGFHGMRIGAMLYNFGTDMRLRGKDLLVYHDVDPNKLGNNDRIFASLETDAWPMPLMFQIGVAGELVQNSTHRITAAIDAMHPSDNTESLNLGAEYAFREMFFLRFGYRNLFLKDSEEGFTFGAGFTQRFLGNVRVRLDYAYADFGRLLNTQRISLGIAF
jgi:hypothetical protein